MRDFYTKVAGVEMMGKRMEGGDKKGRKGKGGRASAHAGAHTRTHLSSGQKLKQKKTKSRPLRRCLLLSPYYWFFLVPFSLHFA